MEEAQEIPARYDQGWVRSPRGPPNMGQHENLGFGAEKNRLLCAEPGLVPTIGACISR